MSLAATWLASSAIKKWCIRASQKSKTYTYTPFYIARSLSYLEGSGAQTRLDSVRSCRSDSASSPAREENPQTTFIAAFECFVFLATWQIDLWSLGSLENCFPPYFFFFFLTRQRRKQRTDKMLEFVWSLHSTDVCFKGSRSTPDQLSEV